MPSKYYYRVQRDAEYLQIKLYIRLEDYRWESSPFADYSKNYNGVEKFSYRPNADSESAYQAYAFARRLCEALLQAEGNDGN